MDDRRLLYFVAVAEELGFAAAAARTDAVQSTVSAGIRSLEQELGVRLFERSPQRVVLTAAGVELLPLARRALAGLDDLRAAARHEPEVRGLLRLGVFSSLRSVDLPAVVGEFIRRHPAVEVRIGPGASGSSGFLQDVRRGRLDLAFLGLATAARDLRRYELARSRFVAVLPEGHRLARRARVPLAELVGERFVDAPSGFGNRASLDAALASRGLLREIVIEAGDLGEIPRFVAAGLGVAAIPALTVVPAPGAVTLPLAEQIEWRLDAVTAVDAGPAAVAFAALLREWTAPLRAPAY